MKKILMMLILSFILCGCSSNSLVDVYKIMAENEHVIVDVRTKEEYETSHIVGAINVPYDEIVLNSFSKNKIIFVYCRSGARSKIAFDKLNSFGYTVYDLGAFDKIELPKE